MLGKKEWNETQLEEIIRQLPKIEDKQNPQIIFQNISSRLEKKKRFTWIIPTFASALALLLFFILVPGMFTTKDLSTEGNHSENDSQPELFEENPAVVEDGSEETKPTVDSDQEKRQETSEPIVSSFSTEKLSAIYEQDLQKYDWITFGIPDVQAQNVVPVTVLVGKDDSVTWFEKYKQLAEKLPQSAWGLSEYFPLEGKVSYNDATEVLEIDLPSHTVYAQGSAGYTSFIHSLLETFSSDEKKVQKVVFSTEGQKGFNGHGDYIEELPMEKAKNRGYFLFTPVDSDKTFLVPSDVTFENIESAIQEMKKEISTHMLTPTVPKDMTIERIKTDADAVYIHFSKGQQNGMDQLAAIHFVEAVLLTAKDFGYGAVKFETDDFEEIGPFNLKHPIKVPLAANKAFVNP